jgi:hypothetical protein
MNDFLADAEPGRHVRHAERVVAGIDLAALRLERGEVEQPAELDRNRSEKQPFRDDVHHGNHGQREGELPPPAWRLTCIGCRRESQGGLSSSAGRTPSPEGPALFRGVAELFEITANLNPVGSRGHCVPALDVERRRGGNRRVKTCSE